MDHVLFMNILSLLWTKCGILFWVKFKIYLCALIECKCWLLEHGTFILRNMLLKFDFYNDF